MKRVHPVIPDRIMNRLVLCSSVLLLLVQISCNHATESIPVEPPYPPLQAMTIPWTDQNSIVCFGTSLTYGFGAGEKTPFCKDKGPTGTRAEYIHYSTEQIIRLTSAHERQMTALHKKDGSCSSCTGDSSYPRFLQELLNIKVYNQGYTAARINTGLDVLQDSVLSKRPVLVLLEFGSNEFLQNVDVQSADSLLRLIVQQILTYGSKIVLLSFVNPDMAQYMDQGNWTTQDSIQAAAYYTMLKGVAGRFTLPLIEYPLKGVFGHPELMSDQLHPNGIGYKKMAENIYYALILTFRNSGMLR